MRSSSFVQNQNSLSIFHVNIKSLTKNFDALYELISSLPVSPDVICVSEARIKGDPWINISIPNYNFFHKDSPTNAEGIAIYALKKHQFKVIQEFKLNLKGCEELWIKLISNKYLAHDITIGAIYQHPTSDTEEFSGTLCNSISKINKHKKLFYVVGDFNIDISAKPKTKSTETYINYLVSCGSLPIITLSTRVTEKSSTIIDDIVTNDTSRTLSPGVIRCDISDHYPIFCYVTGHSIKSKPQTSFLFRDKSHFKVDPYCEKLNFTISNFLANIKELNKNNFDVKFDAFVTLILNIINKHAPIRRLSRTKQKLNCKPWSSKDIYEQIRRKSQMFKSHYIRGDEAMKLEYKKFADNLTKIKTLAKKQYYANELENSRGNP